MSNYLIHYGVAGQKWGLRKYQNPDGSLTALGRERYGSNPNMVGVKRSLNTKLVSGSLNRLNAKRDKMAAKGKDISKLDEKIARKEFDKAAFEQQDVARRDYARNTSTGAAVARRLLMGGMMFNGNTKVYERHRAAGATKGQALMEVMGKNLVNFILPGAGSLVENASYRDRVRKNYAETMGKSNPYTTNMQRNAATRGLEKLKGSISSDYDAAERALKDAKNRYHV